MARKKESTLSISDGQVVINRAYKVRLDPSPRQERALMRCAAVRRFAFNTAVAHFRHARSSYVQALSAHLETGADKSTFTAPESAKYQNHIGLNNAFNAWKVGKEAPAWLLQAQRTTEAPTWVNDKPSNITLWALDEAVKALGRHFDPKLRAGFPRFKSKGKDADRFKVTGTQSLILDATHLRLPIAREAKGDRDLTSLGRIHTRDSLKAVHRGIASGAIKVKTVTVSRDGRGWSVSLSVEQVVQQASATQRMRSNGAVGIDMGVKELAVLSTGDVIANPRHLRTAAAKLADLQRKLARTTKGSANARKLKARIARAHASIAGQRANGLHQTTSVLARSFEHVVVEDLNVKGMSASAKGTLQAPGRNVRAKSGLNKSVLDAAFGEFRRQLQYKTNWFGGTLIVADRYMPSSKTCSSCGAVRTKLSLSERIFECPSCGARLNRDHNAALNLHRLAEKVSPRPAQPGNLVSLRHRPTTWSRIDAGALIEVASSGVVTPTGVPRQARSPEGQPSGISA